MHSMRTILCYAAAIPLELYQLCVCLALNKACIKTESLCHNKNLQHKSQFLPDYSRSTCTYGCCCIVLQGCYEI